MQDTMLFTVCHMDSVIIFIFESHLQDADWLVEHSDRVENY